MAYAMSDLGWKFYFINAAWDFVFLIIAYFTFVETKGLKLEEINAIFESRELTDGMVVDCSQESATESLKTSGYVATKPFPDSP
jgi:hypothetical protein